MPEPLSKNVVDMIKVFDIESSYDAKAHNKGEDARGLGQIRPPALADWNMFNKGNQVNPDDLFDEDKNAEVSDWYMNKRIPILLRYYKVPDTVDNRIIAYNAGINTLVKGLKLPDTTKKYLEKYHSNHGIRNLKRSTNAKI